MVKLRHSLLAFLLSGLALLLSGCKLALLDPKGVIAADEKDLMVIAVFLMLLVVIPVIILSFVFAWRYRAGNTKATYAPNWSHSTTLEIVWWSIPCVIILILGVLTWTSSYRLDPYKPLAGEEKPLIIQAVALDWKWLFVYPEQNIATINYIEIPVNVPIQFLIAAEGAMNSFHIPQLSGQIYAMAAMQTKLHLVANHEGEFRGLSANYSGIGFSDMRFTVRATTKAQFDEWVKKAKQSQKILTMNEYDELTKPSQNDAVSYYSSVQKDLFGTVVMRHMMPPGEHKHHKEHNMKQGEAHA